MALFSPSRRLRRGRIGPLCFAILFLTAPGRPRAHSQAVAGGPAGSLTGQERAEQAVARLSFGARPGEVARVQTMGVGNWIQEQLHPDRIDDSALESRLSLYPAMGMSSRRRMEDFPSAALLRAVEDGRLTPPTDPAEVAIYRNGLAALETRQGKQPLQGPAGDAGGAMAQIPALPPGERLARLEGLTPERLRGFLRGLNARQRSELTAGMTPRQRETALALVNPEMVVTGELLDSRLLTDLYSRRELAAVMTDFWLNHFNVYLKKGPFAAWYLVDYWQTAIAPRALGRFEDLLVATAESPAMLFYLDNQSSIGPDSPAAQRARQAPPGRRRELGLNENYARELMELQTLGVDGGYTQKDVIEVAKVFSGWTIADPRQGGGFLFVPQRHQPGPKYVLGREIAEQGQNEGLEVLHLLAASPATARHLSRELAQRFVGGDPPPKLVARMTATYLHTDGDIREVLGTLFASREFWSRKDYHSQVKTPEEFVLSAVRATGGEVRDPASVLHAMDELGMPFYGCQAPNGYPWTGAAWLNAGDLLSRMNIALELAANRLGVLVDFDEQMRIAGPDELSAAGKAARLEETLLEVAPGRRTRQAILAQAEAEQSGAAMADREDLSAPGSSRRFALPGSAFAGSAGSSSAVPAPADPQAAWIAGLLLGSPDFQKR